MAESGGYPGFGDGGRTRALAEANNDEPVVWGRGAPSARRGRLPGLPPIRIGQSLPPPVDNDPDTPGFGEKSKAWSATDRSQATVSTLNSPRESLSSGDRSPKQKGANKISARERSAPNAPPTAVHRSSPPPGPGSAGADLEDVRVAVREEMRLLLQVNSKQIAQQHEEQLRALEQRLRGGQTFVPESTGMDAVLAQLATSNGQKRAAGGEVQSPCSDPRSPNSFSSKLVPFAHHHEEEHSIGMEVFSDWQKLCATETEMFAGSKANIENKIRSVQSSFDNNYGHLPAQKGWFARAMRSKEFEALSGCIILANTAYSLHDATYSMEMAIQGENVTQVHVGEAVFLSWFTIELILKLVAQGKYFFTAKPDVLWNYFDAFVWFMTCLIIASSATGVNVSFLRVLRCLKLVRLIHMLHFLGFTRQLRTMMESTIQSAPTLIWCLLMIAFFLMLFALFFVQSCSVALLISDGDSALNDNERDDVIEYFGDVGLAVLSLVMITTGGMDWDLVYNTLVPVGNHAVVGLLFYIFFFQIAVWNVVTSIFVENAAQLAKPDASEALFQKRKTEFWDRRALRKMMEKCNVSGSGKMSRDEFIRLMSQSDFQSFLQDRGIEIKEAVTFFSMVAAAIGTDEVDLDALALSCLRIRGNATGIDLNILRYETKLHLLGISSSVTDLSRTVEDLTKAMNSAPHSSRHESGFPS